MLTDRQKLILGAIIYQYTQNAQAVGSKRLQEQLDLPVSSATIRNDMAALEQADLIRKLHTSAGRVPSRLGYRYYLDYLMVSRQVTQADVDQLLAKIRGNFHELDDLLDETAKVIAKLTGCTALILKPVRPDLKLSSFQLISLGGRQVIAVLVTNDGKVTSQTFKLPAGLTTDSLSAMVDYINLQMVGRRVQDVLRLMDSGELPVHLNREIQSPAAFLQLFGQVLARSIEHNVHIGGRLNVLENDDSQVGNLKQARKLLELLDSADRMRQIIPQQAAGVEIKIGAEIGEPLLQSYSLLARSFQMGADLPGVIALIGPVRMPYARNAMLLEAFGQALNQKMTEYI
ncbi:heat-inducible transcriptional repressor HrcA [Lactobacillaceae bacterium L1_55_11]|nr:heat-inducible transcriptional repressor HrcA [Lactobacillaceae bacterium L1_55_11]